MSDLEDAKRYRWLKAQPALRLQSEYMKWTRPDGTEFYSMHILSAKGVNFESLETLDETIDQAMSYKFRNEK